MIKRLVKMHFQIHFIDEFVEIYNHKMNSIKNMNGCVSLQLYQDEGDRSIFFTISYWKSAEDLEAYRSSELFKSTWQTIKPWFASKPEAWSLIETR